MNPEQQAEIASLIAIAEHNDPNGNLTLAGFNQAADQAHHPFIVQDRGLATIGIEHLEPTYPRFYHCVA